MIDLTEVEKERQLDEVSSCLDFEEGGRDFFWGGGVKPVFIVAGQEVIFFNQDNLQYPITHSDVEVFSALLAVVFISIHPPM